MKPALHPSPNFGERRDGAIPDMVVLHYTAMDSTAAALHRLSDPEAGVSAHYLISEAGKVYSLVAGEMRAWHAGAGQWGAVTDVNSRSIGIEIANTGFAPFPEPQMLALERLLHDIMRRWAILPERIIGHSDMAPGRKIDPGPRFDWRRLALGGLSVWPGDGEIVEPDEAKFTDALRSFGMTADASPETLLAAFRLRFRPWAGGPLDGVDMAQAIDIAGRYPVDQLPLTT